MNIEALNYDVLLHLFQYFSQSERLTLKKVCAKWREVIAHTWSDCTRIHMEHIPNFDRDEYYDGLPNMHLEEFQEMLIDCGAFVKNIAISHLAGTSEAENEYILRIGFHYYKIQGFGFPEIFPTFRDRCRNVNVLAIGDMVQPSRFEKKYLVLCQECANWISRNNQLTHLSTSQSLNNEITTSSVTKMPSSLKSLRLSQVDLSWFRKATFTLDELVMDSLILDAKRVPSCLLELKVLHVFYCHQRIRPLIAWLVHLEELDLCEVSLSQEEYLSLSKCCTKIRRVHLGGPCIFEDHIGINNLPFAWPELQELILYHGNDTLIVPNLENLEKLELHYLNVQEEELCNTMTYMPKLRHFKIIDNHQRNLNHIEYIINFLISTAISRKQNFELIIIHNRFARFALFNDKYQNYNLEFITYVPNNVQQIPNRYQKITISAKSQTTFSMTCCMGKFDFVRRIMNYTIRNFPEYPIKFRNLRGIRNYWDRCTFVQ